jgi:hypothetical protein
MPTAENVSTVDVNLKRREGMSFLLRLLATPTEDEFFYCLRENPRSKHYLRSFFLFSEDFLRCDGETYNCNKLLQQWIEECYFIHYISSNVV